MNINRNNYEVFFIDYLDEKLSSVQLEELFGFLAVNPDLEEEFQLLENKKLDISNEKCFFKESLKKQIGSSLEVSNFELECIDFIEGNLSENEKQKVLNKASGDSLNNSILNLYVSTKLEMNDEEKFPDLWTIKKLHPFECNLLNNQTLDYYALACLENDLTLLEKEKFLLAIASNPEWYNTFQKYQLTKLSFEKNVGFKWKSKLKKTTKISLVPHYLLPLSAAASIAVILWFSFGNEGKPSYLARTEKFKSSEIKFEKLTDKAVVFADKKMVVLNVMPQADKGGVLESDSEPIVLQTIPALKVKAIQSNETVAYLSVRQRSSEGLKSNFENLKVDASDEYLSLTQLATRYLKSKIVPGNKVAGENQKEINFWEIAQFGVEKINHIAGTNMSLSTKTDNNGIVQAYAFNAGLISVSRTLATK